ncbi:MAG: DUF5131 family protein [Rhodospirillales bacterium]
MEWTDATWNPVTGCSKIGPGCDHCYAARSRPSRWWKFWCGLRWPWVMRPVV